MRPNPTMPASSSILATPPKAAVVTDRRRLRRKLDAEIYYAHASSQSEMLQTVNGPRYANAGDFRITRDNGLLIDIIEPSHLYEVYEIPPEGELTLDPAQVSRCASSLRFGAAKNAEEFTQSVETLGKARVEGIDLRFTQSQMAELKHRAEKRGQTVKTYLSLLLDRFTQDLWTV